MNPTATAPDEWRYLAEGGANLVLRYVGHDRQWQGQLLRLAKTSRRAPSGGDELTAPEQRQLESGWAGQVIAPLLGHDFVLDMQTHAVSSGWLDSLARLVDASGARQEERRARERIDLEADKLWQGENLVHGNGTFAVEIKPKWAFLPPVPSESPALPIACRFCKHSALRNSFRPPQEALVAHQTGYCPLDLYSGDRERVQRAVAGLFQAWTDSDGQKNNLRLFWKGERLSPQSADEVLAEVDDALPPLGPSTSNLPPRASHIVEALLSSSVLTQLKHLQSTFSPVSSTSLVRRLPTPPPAQPSLSKWTDFLARCYEPLKSPALDAKTIEDELLAQVLSATFKDCSIFVRFVQQPTSEWKTTIKAVDLDPKPIGKIAKWAKLEQEIESEWERRCGQWREEGAQVRECYE